MEKQQFIVNNLKKEESIFEKIISRKIPSTIIFENKKVIAFLDINPKNKGHFLVVPKNKSINLFDIKTNDLLYLVKIARKLALKQIKKLSAKGFKLIINNGKEADQVVFHTHIHIIPYY